MISVYVAFHRMTGVLPLKDRNYGYLGCRFVFVYFLFFSMVNVVMFLRYAVIRLWQGVVELDSIFVTIMAVSTIMRYFVLLNRRSEYRDAIKAYSALWDQCTPSEHLLVRWFERKVWLLFSTLTGSGLLINICCSIGSIAVRLPPDEPNGTERRLLPYRWFLEDQEYNWLGYNVVFGLQVFVTNHLTIITSTIDTAGPLLMMISSGFFKILQERFFNAAETSLKSADTSLHFQRTLIFHLKFHQHLLDLCKNVDLLFRTICLIQILALGYNISLIGLKISGTAPERFQFIPHLILCLGELFITQWSSDCLLEESEGVATAAYCGTVKSLNPKVGILLLTAIRRAQTPVQMTAGGVIKLSLERFGNLITNAISFFTVLRNFTT